MRTTLVVKSTSEGACWPGWSPGLAGEPEALDLLKIEAAGKLREPSHKKIHFVEAQELNFCSEGAGERCATSLTWPRPRERWLGAEWAKPPPHNSDFPFVRVGYPMVKQPFLYHPDPVAKAGLF